MDRVFSLLNNLAFFATLLGVAFIVAMAVPRSRFPSFVLPVVRWCLAALDAAKKKRR